MSRPRRSGSAIALRLGLFAGGLVLAVVAFVGALYLLPADVAVRLGSPALRVLSGAPALPDQIDPSPERSVITDAEGQELAQLFGEANRVVLESDEIAPVVAAAVVATEDANFYDHPGVDHRGVMRAIVANRLAGRIVQGGSTITQQYVKNVLLSGEQTLERKATEAWYAVELERRMSKDEILTAYLNEAYLGRGAYGIGAAAELYFSRSAGELDLAQAALLAGMLRAPESNNPVTNPETALARRDIVLEQMVQYGAIEQHEAIEAGEEPMGLALSPPSAPDHPFFVAYVTDLLLNDERLGEDEAERGRQLYAGGLEIRTTLDPERQEAAEEAIASTLTDPAGDPQATITSIDATTGDVRAMAVGPRDYGSCEPDEDGSESADCPATEVNPAVPGLGGSGRQPGSAFKPFVAAAALEADMPRGWQDTSDSGEVIAGCADDYAPTNYGQSDHGVVAMPEALETSSNVYHVKLAAQVDPPAVVDAGERAGLSNGDLPATCSVALGAGSVYPLELTSAFATLAGGGNACPARAVLEVRSGDDVLLTSEDPACEPTIDPEVASEVTAMLRQVVDSGTGTRAAVDGVDIAGKTGTTNDNHDAWFAGYTGGDEPLATAVWMGYEQPRELADIAGEATVTGGSLPSDMFAASMAGVDGGAFPDPPPERSATVPDLIEQPLADAVNPQLRVVSAAEPEPAATAVDDGEETGVVTHAIVGTYDLHVVATEVRGWEPRGTVLEQSLEGGTSVAAGTMLEVAVSDGEGDPPEMPDLLGLDVDEAQEILEELDLDLEVEVTPRDVEVSAEPADPEDPPEVADVEDVEDVEELGGQVRVIDAPEAFAGEVLAQFPSAGASIEPGAMVELEVARHRLELVLPEPDDEDEDEPDDADDADDPGDDEPGDDDEPDDEGDSTD